MKRIFYSIIVVVLLLVSGSSGFAQGNYTWTNLGPDNLGSITRALAYDSQGNLLAGSQGGGLWRSTTEGSSWERVGSYDEAGANPNITSIAVDGNTIYVATGATGFVRSYYLTDLNFNSNYDYRDQPNGFKGYLEGLPGGGVYISTNGGGSWSPAPATNTADTRNFKGPFTAIQKVFVADGKVFVATAEGLYVSTDGLQTIQKCQGSDAFETAIVFDIEMSGNGTFFAGVHNPNSTIDDSLYTSTDGFNFTAKVDADFFTNGKFSFNGMRIAIAPTDPNIVYVAPTSASQGLNGVFRSNNNGDDFFRYGPQGGPGFRPLNRTGRDAFILEVFPDNANELIVAGNSWYTFLEEDGWTQTAQHTNPTAPNYITRNMYSVLFKDTETIFIGTDQQIIRSLDRGLTFSQQSKGYEGAVTYSVAAIGQAEQSAVVAGTPNLGVVYNGLYDTDLPSKQGFGLISGTNYGEIATSYLHPGSIISQGTDDGIVRSLNAGGAFERFYGVPISPQVSGLVPANSDTIIDRPNANSGGGQLFNSGGPAQTPFVLDELIPESVVGQNLTKESLRDQSEEYLFFASRQYIWLVNGALGDGLQVKWNRVSNQLVNGITEYFSTIAVSGDANHTVWVGSANGGLWRLDRPHDLANYDATNNVSEIHTSLTGGLLSMNGRWISSITVDPQNPERVAIAYAGYGGNVSAVQSFIYLTETGNSNPEFFPVVGFPSKEPVYSVKFVVDPASGESVLLAGTEGGLYSITDIASLGPFFNSTWTNEFGTAFGKVPVYDIDVSAYKSSIFNEETQDFTLVRDNTVYVATHGRGIWSTSNLTFPREGNPNPTELIDELEVSLFPNPNQGQTNLQLDMSADGLLEYSITDISGRQVGPEQRVKLSAGKQEVSLDMSRYSPGLYFIKVNLKTESESLERTLKAVISE